VVTNNTLLHLTKLVLQYTPPSRPPWLAEKIFLTCGFFCEKLVPKKNSDFHQLVKQHVFGMFFLTVCLVRRYHLHDNDKKFMSGLVSEWCHNAGITNLEFPPYSPDLNPIENLWAILKGKVENERPRTKEALIDAIKSQWKTIDIELCARLALSMTRRCNKVINNFGGKIKY
jgi:hypothetical protein